MTEQDSQKQFQQYLNRVQMQKEDCRTKITKVLEQVARDYQKEGTSSLELHQGHDIHAFYKLTVIPSKVIHVQGYPGMSTDKEMRVWARLMDYNRMMQIRSSGGVSIGNEHQATIMPFPNFEVGVMIPYNAKVLEKMLEENIPELRSK